MKLERQSWHEFVGGPRGKRYTQAEYYTRKAILRVLPFSTSHGMRVLLYHQLYGLRQ